MGFAKSEPRDGSGCQNETSILGSCGVGFGCGVVEGVCGKGWHGLGRLSCELDQNPRLELKAGSYAGGWIRACGWTIFA